MLANNLVETLVTLQRRIRSIRQGSTAAVDADRYTADQVAHAHGQPRPEQRVSGIVVSRAIQSLVVTHALQL